MDPNALNLDPDPDQEFWPNLDLDPGLPMLSILKRKFFKIILKKNNLL